MSNLLEFDKTLWGINKLNIIGIDEVGRGCIAGPFVAAGVSWGSEIYKWDKTNPEYYDVVSQIKDSKKISKKKREKLNEFIINNAEFYKIVEVKSDIIDQKGIIESNIIAFNKILIELEKKKEKEKYHVISDFVKMNKDRHFISEIEMYVKGDEQSLAIASASIIAKTYRDSLMRGKYNDMYPKYKFDKNVGYGTKDHIEAIRKHGYSDIHRKSFKVKSLNG